MFVLIGLRSPRTTNQNTDMAYFRSSACCVHVHVYCIQYMLLHVHYKLLSCNVGVKLDCVCLCKLNVGKVKIHDGWKALSLALYMSIEVDVRCSVYRKVYPGHH